MTHRANMVGYMGRHRSGLWLISSMYELEVCQSWRGGQRSTPIVPRTGVIGPLRTRDEQQNGPPHERLTLVLSWLARVVLRNTAPQVCPYLYCCQLRKLCSISLSKIIRPLNKLEVSSDWLNGSTFRYAHRYACGFRNSYMIATSLIVEF